MIVLELARHGTRKTAEIMRSTRSPGRVGGRLSLHAAVVSLGGGTLRYTVSHVLRDRGNDNPSVVSHRVHNRLPSLENRPMQRRGPDHSAEFFSTSNRRDASFREKGKPCGHVRPIVIFVM